MSAGRDGRLLAGGRGEERRELLAYFALAYAISWILWAPLVLASRGVAIPRPFSSPLWHFTGALGPIAAACIVTYGRGGAAALRGFLAGFSPRRGGWGWQLAAFVAPAVIFAVAWVAVGATTGEWAALRDFGRSPELPALGLAGNALFQVGTFGAGEETGWRGFALPRLQAHHGALTATLLLTLGWAAWHAPAFFYRPGYAAMGPGLVVGWLLSLATGAIVLTWLFNRTGSSLLAVSLFHGATDVVFTSPAAQGAVQSAIGFILIAGAVALVAIWGPRKLGAIR